MQTNDFRNAPILADTRYEPFEISDRIKDICIRAGRSVNSEMGGVDILFDKQNQPYLLEVNFPTGFQSFKDNLQPILLRWIDFLIKISIQH